jgi:hypothetical protein
LGIAVVVGGKCAALSPYNHGEDQRAEIMQVHSHAFRVVNPMTLSICNFSGFFAIIRIVRIFPFVP